MAPDYVEKLIEASLIALELDALKKDTARFIETIQLSGIEGSEEIASNLEDRIKALQARVSRMQ